jgi:hypothetical protein
MNARLFRYASVGALLALSLGSSLPTAAHVASAAPVAAGVRYAAPSALGTGDCLSWANACTLQTALGMTNSLNGDEIWVKAGVHTPGALRTDSFRVLRNTRLYGGFAGTETALNQRNWVANLTLLSGDIGVPGVNTDNSYHVVWVDGVALEPITGSTVIDGFTLTGGNGDLVIDRNFRAGGLYCFGGASGKRCSPTLANLIISGNQALYGAGIYNDGSGGGLSSPTLTNVTFSGNTAVNWGGAMYNDGWASPGSNGSSPTLINVAFIGNQAQLGDGGGMFNIGNGRPALINVTFSGNLAGARGGGMFNKNDGGYPRPTLVNTILWGNTASAGPQIYNTSGATPDISYSLIEGTCPAWSYCNDGILYNIDPLFVNAAIGNLRLSLSSPAIDAGYNAAVPGTITNDLDGKPRFREIVEAPNTGIGTPPIVDMGAYEVQPVPDLHFTPAATLVAAGEQVPITIDIGSASASIENLAGYQFEVNYNKTVLNGYFKGLYVNSFFDAASNVYRAYDPPSFNDAAGVGKYAVTKLAPAPGAAVTTYTGYGTLGSVSFTATTPGVSVLSFSNVLFSDAAATGLPVSSSTATVTVYGFAIVNGTVKMQGRATPITAGPVTLVDTAGVFAGPYATTYDPTTGAFSMTVPALAAGTTYTLAADHDLYLGRFKLLTVTPGNTYAQPTTTLRGGDANNDERVSVGDLTCIGSTFGTAVPTCAGGSSDINADGIVNIFDLVIAGGNFGLPGPNPGDFGPMPW